MNTTVVYLNSEYFPKTLNITNWFSICKMNLILDYPTLLMEMIQNPYIFCDYITDPRSSFDMPRVQADENNYGHVETPHPIPEYPAQPQLQSKLPDGLKRNDLALASQAALPQDITLTSSEVTQETAILLKDQNHLHRQNVSFQMQSGLLKMEPKISQNTSATFCIISISYIGWWAESF